MATYNTIKFDIDHARQVILDECDKAMKSAIDKHFSGLQYSGAIDDVTRGITTLDYEVIFEDIRAWVMFFGKGKAIEWSNPYLKEYMSNKELWADGRTKSGTLVRRGVGTYKQYDYYTGELKEYEGTEPKGEELPRGLQANRTRKPTVDFWETIREIYETFLESFDNIALPNIERRFSTECFTIEQHKI